MAVDVREALTESVLLNADEIAHARAAVHGQREHWISRNASYPFYTLGTASYIDARGGRFAQYQEQARRTNAVLSRHFGWLLERLRLAVSAHVGATARYDDRLALPGFHVFLFHPSFQHSVASVHYDLQYELVDWTGIGTPEAASQLSLTLAVMLPASGGGLFVWNLNRLELDRMSPEDRQAHAAANQVGTRMPYTAGHLVIHSGHQLHRIAAVEDPQPADERITLQAHALRVDGEWLIYW